MKTPVTGFMGRSIGKILGKGKLSHSGMGMGSIPNVNRHIGKATIARDGNGFNMVHYGYYEGEDDEGKIHPHYAESRKQAKHRLLEKGHRIKSMKDLTYAEALGKYGEVGLFEMREHGKRYKKLKDKDNI